MKKNIFALIALLFAIVQTNLAQDPVVINFSSATASGPTVTVDVTADNFMNIAGMQLFIGWDESVLHYSSITNINSELDGFNSSSFATPPQIPEGHVNVSWFSTNPLGESENLPDGTILFSIVLTTEGDPCDETTFELVDYNGQPNEAYDGNFNEVDVQFTPGLINIPGEDCGGGGDQFGIGLIGEEISAENGTNVCVAITVDSFVNINSAQFAIQYDQTVLEYVDWQNSPLTDILVNPTGTNHVRVLWLVPSNEGPNTLADGTTLIEFCFNVIGDMGDCSPIDIISITTPPALEIEFINGDGQVVDYYTQAGEVCVGDPMTPEVTFIASNETGDLNETVCLDITCENFEDVGSFQWAFAWDDDVMSYNGLGPIKNININPTDINQVSPNKIRVSWLPTTAVTKPDNTILFQLCFDMDGDCDDSTLASFTDDGGTFQIEVGDGDGNSLDYAVVNGSASIECACFLDFSTDDVSCNGEKDGNIYITLTGCDAQSFKWNTGQTTQNLEGIGAGNYQITVTDSNGGETVSPIIVVNEPTTISVVETITNVTCQSNGSISLNVQGGTPGYQFNWFPEGSGSTASNLDPGTYSVTITDQNDCEAIRTYGITTNVSSLEIDGSMTDITCKDANDGSINITATGGCPNYNITWNDGQAAGQFSRNNLAAGLYTPTVTDATGQMKTISFSITNPTFALQISGNVTPAIINGADGSIDVSVSGGEPDYEYAWSNGASSEDITAGGGTYTLFVVDARGCSTEMDFTIPEIYDEVVLTANVADLYNGYGVSCYGECDGKINLSVTGNFPWTLYVNGAETDWETFPQMDFCPGDYEIKVIDDLDNEDIQMVTVSEPDQLEVTLADEIICSNGDDGSITISVTGGVEDYVYDWGISGEDDDYLEGLDVGVYGVVVTDANKCQALLSDLEVNRCETGDCFKGSPVITPNGDGLNDVFTIACLRDYPDNTLEVYDRWGRKIYTQSNYDGLWGGMGTDGELDEGSYMWVLVAKLSGGDERVYKGTLTILR